MTSFYIRASAISFGLTLLTAQSATVPASAQPCGTDAVVTQPHELNRETLVLAADRRLFSPCVSGSHGPEHLEQRDLALLDRAITSTNAEFRRLAVQAFGRFGSSSMAPRIFPLLDDPSVDVRMAAANAVAQALSGTRSDLRDDPTPTAAEITAGRIRLEARLEKEIDDAVVAVMVATIGRMRHDATELPAVEALLIARSAGSPARLLGAAEGWEQFARRNPRRPLTEEARARLRDLASLGKTAKGDSEYPLARLRRLSMTALQIARDTDTVTMLEAATDPDWQVRRIAAQMMNPAVDRLRPAVLALLKDPQLHVRVEAVRAFARGLQTIRDCGPLVTAMSDTAPLVSLQAMDSVATTCTDVPAVVGALTPIADRLGDAAHATQWHRPARALTALARVAPEDARKRMAAAKSHQVWQVRATVATAAGVLSDAAIALELSKDPVPNVQTAAIDALARMKSPETSAAAIASLKSTDHQVVRSAAMALRASTHPDAVPALFASLRRLTAGGSDTSRDPRVAIIERLTELLGAVRVGELAEWTGDWDTAVRAAAVRAFTAAKVDVPSRPRLYRYPAQPTVAELRDHLSAKQADIVLEAGGTITINFIPGDAPMTISRFISRARAGLYDGLTFHRVVPNFVVQGLSPGANEYVGDDRFMRDEVSLQSHTRGAVGISTRGYDTGDAQIFFDLVDVPRLDHDYTVFAKIISGIEHLDAMLEGARVRRVVIR